MRKYTFNTVGRLICRPTLTCYILIKNFTDIFRKVVIMKGKLKKNQRGSVLLAVVCMSMMCMVLATIALSVVNYTTKASSRNVQRTQAKITAEAALSEFIQYYNSNDAYADLKNLASAGDGTEITVDMIGDSNFKDTYGDVKLYVKKNGASGFKVTAECTYSTQTQTVSVVFDSIKQNPNIPSNVLEASEGADFTGGVASPMDGDICLEKKTTGETRNSITLGSNDAVFASHILSEYNLYFNSGTKYQDVLNKSGSLNYAPNIGGTDGKYFQQAPTITTTGYMSFDNNVTISTSVGKTDINGNNSDDANYDAANLSNKDGYIRADQKIYFGMPNATHIGTSDRPIDVYTHGIYVGPIPQNINGNVNPDYDTIHNGFNEGVKAESSTGTINGNVYCYTGTNPTYQSGDLFVMNGAQSFIVNGDLYVEGNIYIKTGSDGGSKLKANTIHCQRNIYFVDDNCNIVATAGIDGGAIKFSENNSGRADSTLASQLSGSLSVTFDKQKRGAYPKDGYDPSTGVDNVSRKSLKTTYGDSSANSIFAESLGSDPDLVPASKHIAEKYAAALTRTIDTKKFTKSNGTIADLAVPKKGSSNEDTVVEINGSLRLRSSDFNTGGSNLGELKRYCVNLTDEDIIIAVPFDKGTISPLIRVNATGAQDGCFVYIMYYEEDSLPDFSDADQDNNIVKGYYFNGTSANPNEITINDVRIYDNSTHSFASQKVIFTTTTEAERTGKKVDYNPGGKSICYVADLELFLSYSLDETVDLSRFKTICNSKLPDDVVDLYSGESYDNRICYLVPDNFEFELGDNCQLQGLLYATKSKVNFIGSGTRFYGQVKCGSYSVPNDAKTGIVRNIPAAGGSILDFVYAKNSTTNPNADIEIMYYDYRQ